MRTLTLLLLLTGLAPARKFYADDPVIQEPQPRDAGAPKNRKLSDLYDLFSQQFGRTGERQPASGAPIRARGVNTLGDPMEGAWWERRHYWKPLTEAELMRGPGDAHPPSRGGSWTIIGAKTEGVTPGFVMLDANKRMYFVKFDPKSNPEMATAADQISSKIFHAMGYHVPENYLVYFTEEDLVLGDDVQLADATGKKRKMTRRDLLEVLLKVPRTKEGKYRATASLALPGKPIGPPRYYGMRTDDPNDIVPHEHRRDQRALQVFCAWVGHEDSRSINNLDVLATAGGTKYVKHYLLDFGSTLGSASTGPNSARSGAYFFDWTEAAKNFFSLGLRIPYYATARYPKSPAVGKFEAKTFDPLRWVPEYPNPAFLNMLPDDAFWAAKQVMSLKDADLRAIVKTAEFSDPADTEIVTQALIDRRDKIGKAFFAQVLPLDRFTLGADRMLAWQDLSGEAGAVDIQWHAFDNDRETRTPLPGAATAKAPALGEGEFACAELTRRAKPSHKVFVYVRQRAGVATIVGIEREW